MPAQCKMVAQGLVRAKREGWHGPASIAFVDCYLGDDHSILLPQLLASALSLVHLSLPRCYIGPMGAGLLAKGLALLTNLTSLDLAENEMEGLGATRLAASLRWLTQLTSLDLSINDAGPAGCARIGTALLACTRLTMLSVTDNTMGAGGMRGLAPLLAAAAPSLRTFAASDNSLRRDGVAHLAAALAQCSALVQLDLSRNDMGDAGLAHLLPLLQGPHALSLTHLDLSENAISHATAATLAHLLHQRDPCADTCHLLVGESSIGHDPPTPYPNG
jgi:Ran GTPase-activating protein (RanGAP) involved in mRNA processing and transport